MLGHFLGVFINSLHCQHTSHRLLTYYTRIHADDIPIIIPKTVLKDTWENIDQVDPKKTHLTVPSRGREGEREEDGLKPFAFELIK